MYDSDGNVLDVLEFYGLPADGLNYLVEARVHFDSLDVTWQEGPFEVGDGELASVAIEAPANACQLPEQLTYVSDLSVKVIVMGSDGGELSRWGAPLLVIAYDALGGEPIVMDTEVASELAPGGAWDLAAPARDEFVSESDLGEVQ